MDGNKKDERRKKKTRENDRREMDKRKYLYDEQGKIEGWKD